MRWWPRRIKMLGNDLRRLHIIRADQVDIVEVAGAKQTPAACQLTRPAIAQLAYWSIAPAIITPSTPAPPGYQNAEHFFALYFG
jgi:hypothetical protein